MIFSPCKSNFSIHFFCFPLLELFHWSSPSVASAIDLLCITYYILLRMSTTILLLFWDVAVKFAVAYYVKKILIKGACHQVIFTTPNPVYRYLLDNRDENCVPEAVCDKLATLTVCT